MAKTKTPRRPKAETPKGFRDYFGAEVTRRKAMLDAIAAVYERYGFDPLETSAVETVEALGKFLPDVDRPNEGVFAWDEGEAGKPDWLALRYDLTAPLARVYAQHRNDLPTPYRRYAMGPVWRNEKPGPGRFRQFYQCDADTVGAASVAADAEICMMLADVLEAVGVERGDYIIRVSSRTVLNETLERVGLFDPADFGKHAERRAIASRAIDKLDRLGPDGVKSLLGDGRRDESGDFTVGAGLREESIELIAAVLDSASRNQNSERAILYRKSHVSSANITDRDNLTLFNIFDALWHPDFTPSGSAELLSILEIVRDGGYGSDRIVIDPSVVRGLGYYTGPVFEAELTFQITDETGQPRNFGSVAGGGRYDDLVTRFTGQAVPATGVSIGVDRLLAALDAKGRAEDAAPGPVVVTVMDRDRMADYQSICATLRRAGIRAEVYLGNPKNFGNQLKYADKRRSPAAIIQGSDEAARGVVQVKDLILGAKLAQEASVEEWRENPSQAEVPLDGLVAHLKTLLG